MTSDSLGLLLLAFVIVLLIVAWVRNEQVYEYRLRMIQAVFRDGPDESWRDRRRILQDVSHNAMMFKFWRPWPTLEACRGEGRELRRVTDAVLPT